MASSYPQISLSLTQELFLENTKRSVHKIPRDQLENMFLMIIAQKFAYENAFKEEMKRNFSPSNIL